MPCVIGLFNDYEKSGNIIGICIGVFLLLCCQDVLDFDMFWKLIIPVIVVMIGVKMIFGNIFGNHGVKVHDGMVYGGGENAIEIDGGVGAAQIEFYN